MATMTNIEMLCGTSATGVSTGAAPALSPYLPHVSKSPILSSKAWRQAWKLLPQPISARCPGRYSIY